MATAAASPGPPSVGAADLPRRDPAARARLREVARAGTPVVLARERCLEVPGPLGEVVPGLRRGAVVAVEGPLAAGATSLALGLVAAASAVREWAAAVDGSGTLGGLAAGAAGVDLARFAVVREVPAARWAVVVAALLDGMSVVLAEVPRGVRVADARRLVARAREQDAVLITLGPWPAAATLRLHAEGGAWTGLGAGDGVLAARELAVRVEGSGAPVRGHVAIAG